MINFGFDGCPVLQRFFVKWKRCYRLAGQRRTVPNHRQYHVGVRGVVTWRGVSSRGGAWRGGEEEGVGKGEEMEVYWGRWRRSVAWWRSRIGG